MILGDNCQKPWSFFSRPFKRPLNEWPRSEFHRNRRSVVKSFGAMLALLVY